MQLRFDEIEIMIKSEDFAPLELNPRLHGHWSKYATILKKCTIGKESLNAHFGHCNSNTVTRNRIA